MSIASPCNKICVLDATSGLCLGCGRTTAEIGGWLLLPNERRLAVMAELTGRLASHGLAPSGRTSTRKTPSALQDGSGL